MSSTLRNLGLAHDNRQDSREEIQYRSSSTRDKLAVSHSSLDRKYPEALDLCSTMLDMMSQELRGKTDQLCGTLGGDLFRKAMRGERPFRLADFCRLAKSMHPSAKAAVRAALKFISAAATESKPLNAAPTTASVAEAAADCLEQITAATAQAIRTEGRMTAADGLALIRRLEAVRLRAEDMESAVMQAIGGRRI